MRPDELDDLFRKDRKARPAPSAAFEDRVLADAHWVQSQFHRKRPIRALFDPSQALLHLARALKPAAVVPLAASLLLLIQPQLPRSDDVSADPVWEVAVLAGEEDPDLVLWLSGWSEGSEAITATGDGFEEEI